MNERSAPTGVALGVAEQLSPSAFGHAISGRFRGDELMRHALPSIAGHPSVVCAPTARNGTPVTGVGSLGEFDSCRGT